MQPSPERMVGWRIHDRFGLLLILLLASLLAEGLGTALWQRVLTAVLLLAAFTVTFVASDIISARWAAWVLPPIVIVSAVLLSDSGGTGVEFGLGSIGAAVTTATMLMFSLLRVLRHKTVTLQTIFGAVCCYLLIGSTFASVYGAVDGFDNTAVFGRVVAHTVYSYFSLVTLTTVGYGDYTPVGTFAQRVAVIEAVIGQIFLATTLARLVSLFKAER